LQLLSIRLNPPNPHPNAPTTFCVAFDQARKVNSKCTVLFFDEIDALGQSRGGGGGGHHEQSSPSSTDQSSRRVLAELLIQLNRVSAAHGIAKVSSSSSSSFSIEDSASVSSGDAHRTEMYIPQDDSTNSSMSSSSSSSTSRVRIIVVAATNRPEDCDTALLRRFAVRVMVNLPTQRDRKKILKRYLRDVQHSLSSDHLHTLALETQGWTGSDLESLTREAAMAPIRECIRAAALMKRRNRRWGQTGTPLRQHQCGGSSTSQQDSTISPEKQLLEQFSNLRPVTILDFMNAIAFWAYNHGPSDMPPGERAEKGTFNSETIHYDSSSDEED
jgi:SpoVK/Ycf46/Vps4 family AAA+-type ATPase